jgi:transcriptional regulator with XRE-family HTH domain
MRVELDPIKLRAAMRAAGMSHGQLAKLTGIPRSHVSRYCRVPGETGKVLDVRVSTLAKLATALGKTSIEPFLRYRPDEPGVLLSVEPGPALSIEDAEF